MKKIIMIGAGLLMLAGLAAAVYYFGLRGGERQEWSALTVARGNLKISVATTGVIKPQNRVEIKPTMAGRIETVLIDEGQAARKGQILAWMSSTERAMLLDIARAKGEQEVSYWEDAYKPMPIVAPIEGDIIARNVEAGQTVNASEKLFVIANRLIVQAQVDETDIGRVKPGQAVEFNVDAYPADLLTGQVATIAYEAQIINNVTMYMVDIVPDLVPPFMRSGMTANIQIIIHSVTNVLTLPMNAVRQDNRRTIVQQAQQVNGRKIIQTEITAGLNDGKKIEIVAGLKEGDRVLTRTVNIPAAERTKGNPLNPFRRPRR